jgi:hypothetical protein
MNAAASKTMKEIPDVVFGYGSSDEFRSVPRRRISLLADLSGSSFVLHKDCNLFDRRAG